MELNSTSTEPSTEYARVRVWTSLVAFVILFFFNVLINWTIVREGRLRGHARFVLVFHLLCSATIYFAVCFLFYLQIYADVKLSVHACAALITVLTTSASNILLTITAMALDRYVAICFPLRYGSVRFRLWPWLLGVVTWALASIIPLSLFPKGHNSTRSDSQSCNREQLKSGEVHKILLISICSALILYSYVRILCVGRRLGVLNRRNRAGCRTITLHMLQLAVYILPNIFNFVLHVLMRQKLIHPETKERFAVITFVFFSLAQCIAPIVYGLRKEELLEHLRLRFPRLSSKLKSLLERTVGITNPLHPQRQRFLPQSKNMDSRERRMTSETLLSRELSQTTV